MKRLLSIALVVVMALSFASCGKSKDARKVDELIEAIGDVTLKSEDKIVKAEKALEKLSREDKQQVENKRTLRKARDAYDELVEQAEIDKVKDAIDAIGDVTLNSSKDIDAAAKAYDALDDEKKKEVSNYAVLEEAKAKLKELKLEEAETLLAKFRLDEDRVRNYKFYYPGALKFYSNGSWAADVRCFTLPYIGRDESSAWLRVIYNYTGDDWVFFESIIFNVDGKQYTKSYSYYDIVRDNEAGDVWEYVDDEATEDDIEMLRAIANSSETLVRFQGDDYSQDYTVSAEDKAAIVEILDAYEAIK